LRNHALAAWRAGVAAAHPGGCVSRYLEDNPEVADRVADALIIAFGKAAVAMAEALGERASGVALAPHGAKRGRLPVGIELLHASHPVPDTTGLTASRKILRAVSALGEGDCLICLISGGASSLFEVPDPRVSDQELIAIYDGLVRSGGDIHQINIVRSALSSVKGGRLAAAAAPATVITFAISDVAGDDPATIGSGPSAPIRHANAERALDVARRLQLTDLISPSVREALAAPSKPGPAEIERFEVLASSRTAAAAARGELARLGYAHVDSGPVRGRLTGPSDVAVEEICARVREYLGKTGAGGAAGITFHGETTVKVPENAGKGGRNLHMAARMALALEGVEGFSAVVAGTDGRDGNSDAAGAVIDGETARRAAEAGYPLELALERYDTMTALDVAGDVLRTGPTGTNVEDLVVITLDPGRAQQR